MDGPQTPENVANQISNPELQDVFEYRGGRLTVTPVEGRALGSDWLGVETKPGGKTIDSATKELTVEGIRMQIDQRSQGLTGIYAKPLEGHKLAVLDFDPESGEPPTWKENFDPGKEITVAEDRGNMLKHKPGETYPRSFDGNPGWRKGIIRVTNPQGEINHYALGAKFRGEPDNWNVQSVIAKVDFKDVKFDQSIEPQHK